MKHTLTAKAVIKLSVVWTSLFVITITGLFSMYTPKALAAEEAQNNNGHFSIEGEWIDRHQVKLTKFDFTDEEYKSNELGDLATPGKYDVLKARILASLGEFTSTNISPDSKEIKSFYRDAVGAACSGQKQELTIQNLDATGNPADDDAFFNSNNFRIADDKTQCVHVIANAAGLPIPGKDNSRNLHFNLSNPNDNRRIWFRQKPGEPTINRVDGQADGFKRDENNHKLYFLKRVGPGNGCSVNVEFQNEPSKGVAEGVYHTCEGNNPDIGVKVVFDQDQAPLQPTPDGSTTGAPTPDCEIQLLNPLTWLMCPIITAGVGAVGTLDNAITSQLNFDTKGNDSLLNEGTVGGKALFNTWASFRYISLGLLVIIGLVMILSQALSFGVFDAYTIKKLLPKILIGVVGVSVSWYVCKFAIEVANDLGLGVRSLLYGPFKTLGPAQFNSGVTSLLSVGAGVAVVGLGVVGILSFIVAALMAVMIAFAILVFRRILIILLVVTAPVAIICWILPNTQKVWSMWWDFFSRALLVFPIITLFIAGGRVVAAVATTTSNGTKDGFLNSSIAFIAYFGPYFALPAAFRLAGGAIATVGGMANDRSRGVFDRLKKGRQERMTDRFARARNEKLYNPNNPAVQAWKNSSLGKRKVGKNGKTLGDFVDPNKAATWVASPHKNAAFALRDKKVPFASAYGRNLLSGINKSTVEQSNKLFQEINEMGANDKTYRVLGGMWKGLSGRTQAELTKAGFSEGQAIKSEADINKAAHILSHSEEATESLAGTKLHENANEIASLFQHEDMNYADVQAASLMGLAAHGFADSDDIVTAGNAIAGRTSTGLADAVATKAELYGARARPDIKAGYGHTIKDGKLVNGMTDGGRNIDLLETLGQGDISQAKGGFLRKMGGDIEKTIRLGSEDESKRALQEVNDLKTANPTWKNAEIKDHLGARGEEVLKRAQAARLADPLKHELMQAASRYSQSPTDTKAEASRLIGNLSDIGLDKEYEYNERAYDPAVHGGPPPGGPDPGGPPGGAPPGGGGPPGS